MCDWPNRLRQVCAALVLSCTPAAADDLQRLRTEPDFALHYDFEALAPSAKAGLLRWAASQPRLETGETESCSTNAAAGVILAWKQARSLYADAQAFRKDRQRVLIFMDEIDAQTRAQVAGVPKSNPVAAELRRRVIREQPWAGMAAGPWLAQNPDTSGNAFQLFFLLLRARACAEQISNTTWLKQTLRRTDWPQDQRAADDAWLIAQHSDHDPAFQQEALARLGKALQHNPALAQDYAYLQDRVSVRLGKPQIYGTQFHPVCGGNRPYPIEDKAGLDRRRARVGLGPWADYDKQIGKPCRAPEQNKRVE